MRSAGVEILISIEPERSVERNRVLTSCRRIPALTPLSRAQTSQVAPCPGFSSRARNRWTCRLRYSGEGRPGRTDENLDLSAAQNTCLCMVLGLECSSDFFDPFYSHLSPSWNGIRPSFLHRHVGFWIGFLGTE